MKGIEIIEQAVKRYNQMDIGTELPLPLNTDMPLYGVRSPFDSLGFMAFVMLVEESYDYPINLTSQENMDHAFSIFGTVGTLGEYLDKVNGNKIQKDC